MLIASAPMAYAQNEESEAKKAAIMDEFSKGNDAKAMGDLEGVLSTAKYEDLKEWAQLELYNRAQAGGELAKVTADLEKLAQKNPNDVLLQRAVAEGYLRQRNFAKVISIYEDLAKKNPKDSVIQIRLTGYYILGKEFDKAIARLEPAVNEDPENDYNSDLLLSCYTQAGMQDKALVLFKKRLDKDPDSPGLRARYAQALQDFGILDDSAKEWETAYNLDPRNLFFKQRAGEIYAQSGDSAKAKQQFQKVISSAKDNQEWLKQKAEESMADLNKKK
jgi:tetratricopeptide (TPR) repeat protein